MPEEPIRQILRRITTLELLLPNFQRDFVWRNAKVTKLIASLMKNFPIGAMLFMETNRNTYAANPLDGVPEGNNENQNVTLILDGQQRLTSIYKAFFGTMDNCRLPGRYYFDYGRFITTLTEDANDLQDIELEEYIIFHPAQYVNNNLFATANEMTAGLFPLDIIFQERRGTIYSRWLNQYTFDRAAAAANVQEEFYRLNNIQAQFMGIIEILTAYSIKFEIIPADRSPEVICTIFETINTTGQKLDVFDLLVAKCFPSQIYLRTLLNEVLEEPLVRRVCSNGEPDEEFRTSNICSKALPRIIAIMETGSAKRGQILGLTANQINNRWADAKSALIIACEYLLTHCGCIGLRFIPMPDMIPPLAVILSNDHFNNNEETHRGMLKKWYWRAVFGQYFSNAADSKAGKSVKEWLENRPNERQGWLFNNTNVPEVIRNFTLNQHVLDDVANTTNAIYRGVISMLIANRARDWVENYLADLDGTQVEDHHIYPNRWLRNNINNIQNDRINSILNRTPINKNINRDIGDESPSVYMQRLNIENEVLNLHCIPVNFDNYETFLVERKNLLFQLICSFVDINNID